MEPPDQGAATEAAQEIAAARRDIASQLGDGSLTIGDVFQMSGKEDPGVAHRVVGHMHIRAVLLALPHIGETKADEILAEVGLEGDRHIDTIGSWEQQRLIEAAAAV